LQFQQPVKHAQLVKPNLVTRVVSQFDGVGWDKARKIGKRFNMLQFMEATKDVLMTVEGIGSKLAEGIIEQRENGV